MTFVIVWLGLAPIIFLRTSALAYVLSGAIVLPVVLLNQMFAVEPDPFALFVAWITLNFVGVGAKMASFNLNPMARS